MSPDGTDEVKAWFDQAPKKVQGKFISRLKSLHTLPFDEWQLPLFRPLRRELAGLGEVRFKGADNIQYRPIGFRSGPNEYTILFCAKERSNRFVPRNAGDIALERKSEVENGSTTNALWLALE